MTTPDFNVHVEEFNLFRVLGDNAFYTTKNLLSDPTEEDDVKKHKWMMAIG